MTAGSETSVSRYRVSVPESELADLRTRLHHTRWPERETVTDWSQGVPLDYVRDLAEYWQREYDWRSREEALNRFDHFITEIDGVDIHFIHQRSPHPEAMPLIVTHGWPGSIVEFSKVIEPLTDPTRFGGRAEDAFHVVCPSLPGYGFSGKPSATGWNIEKIALAWTELMRRLGYSRFVAQGGDWGSAVATALGRNGDPCIGIHLNWAVGVPTAEALVNPTDADRRALAAIDAQSRWGRGYSEEQATRPQTIGYALVDSPVGQLAWIIEKFWAWSDCDGHPENIFSRDDLLDDVMLYWLTRSGASSARLYWESFRTFFEGGERVDVPTGVAAFPGEIVPYPRSWCEERYHITHWTEMPRGGHFAALEQPELYVDDVRTFFATLRATSI